MVITMLEARVAPDNEKILVDEYGGVTGELPPFIVETFLLRAKDSDVWRIVTVWRSSEDLEHYRASVETPEGVRVFRDAGAEPTLTIFEVVTQAAH
jgi:heme-degrading monooxygenase HmoA